MECQICYAKVVKYKIQCGSSVAHQICYDCEREWRLKAKPTSLGRFITCPFCRKEEKEPGLRGRSSYEAELKLLYQQLYSKPERARVPPVRPVPVRAVPVRVVPVSPPSPQYVDSDEEIPFAARRTPTTCKNVSICHTRSTARKCTYPGGCTENVCRACKMCVSHFEFNPPLIAPRREAREIWD